MAKIIRTSAMSNGFYNKDRFLISLFFALGIGILIGSIASGSNFSNENSILFKMHNSYIQSRSEQSFLELFWGVFLSEFLYLLICYILGLCAIGIPFLYTIPLIYGIGKGIILGFLYAEGGFSGILNSILFYSVQGVGLSSVLIIALKKSYKMSLQAFSSINSSSRNSKNITLKKYNQFYIIILLIAVLFCAVDALMFKINVFN